MVCSLKGYPMVLGKVINSSGLQSLLDYASLSIYLSVTGGRASGPPSAEEARGVRMTNSQ